MSWEKTRVRPTYRTETTHRVSWKSMETLLNLSSPDDSIAGLRIVDLPGDALPEALQATDHLLKKLAQASHAGPPKGLCERTVARCQAQSASPGKSPVW